MTVKVIKLRICENVMGERQAWKQEITDVFCSFFEYRSLDTNHKLHPVKITADVVAAQAYGASGTPFNLIVTEAGVVPVRGALPYDQWVQLLARINEAT